jgi:hypothetical protein
MINVGGINLAESLLDAECQIGIIMRILGRVE